MQKEVGDARKIVWAKWVNPLTGRGEEDRVTEYDKDPFDDETPKYKDRIDDLIETATKVQDPKDKKLGPCVVGPMGVIPITEHGDPAVVYDFWMMHTNFPITGEVEHVGSNVLGVEAWDTFSPYRARIAFGKAFERHKVMLALHAALGVLKEQTQATATPTNPKNVAVEALTAQLRKTHQSWAIILDENGHVSVVNGKDDEEVKGKLEPWKESSVTIHSSWEQPCASQKPSNVTP